LGTETNTRQGVPENYARLTCNLIGLLGLRGITTLFSSGDGGLGGSCLAPDFKTVEFTTSFPAGCPYVTAVGGTVGTTPEAAWNFSSGGFSKYFARQSWQNATMTEYLATQVSNETMAYYGQFANFGGRGFPDVAAHSYTPGFQVVYAGKLAGSGGTSASAPVWGAIVGLLNDVRLRAGKPAMGWLNPFLYQYGKDALIDITQGYTVGCTPPSRGGSGVVLGARWNATVGWDPTTGWGTPDFQALKSIVMKL
jgi:tripeptidyl-peptidase I